MPHAVASASAGANDVSVLILCQDFELFTNGSSPNTLVDMVACHHRFNLNDAMAHGKRLGVA
jgi:pullulanase/glycogen debranching enzyme